MTTNPTKALVFALGLAGVALLPAAHADSLFTIRQSYTVTNVPDGARRVRGWFWMPEDRPEQKVVEFKVTKAPESLRVTRDPRYGRSWLYAELPADNSKPMEIVASSRFCVTQ